MNNLIKYMEEVQDFRDGFNLKHKLSDILTIAILAILSGAETWNAIELYGKQRLDMLKRFLELPSGIPSHDTFNRVFAMLDPARLEAALSNWVRSLVPDLEGEHIAIDGKSIRGSNKPTSHSFVHMVSAFACGNGISLAQVKVDEKSNEITAIPKLLDMLDVRGCTISIDAMGCQKDIAAKIIQGRGDYILAVKENQPSLHLDALLMGRTCRPDDVFTETDGGHGRVETRTTSIYRDMDYVSNFWAGAAAVIKVETRRFNKTEGKYDAAQSRYFITSRNSVKAEDFSRWVRAHWGIENRLHWVLDMAFNEDASQKRAGNSAENFSRMLRLARNILKVYKEESRTRLSYRLMMFKAAMDPEFPLEVLRTVFA